VINIYILFSECFNIATGPGQREKVDRSHIPTNITVVADRAHSSRPGPPGGRRSSKQQPYRPQAPAASNNRGPQPGMRLPSPQQGSLKLRISSGNM